MISKWIRVAVPATALVMLAACGGGGGGGGGGNNAENLGEKAFPSAAATQGFADDAVGEINSLVEEISQADAAGGIGVPIGFVSPPTGASFTETYNCSELFGNGSGTARITVVTNNDEELSSLVVVYNDCSYSSGGYTYTYDGRFSFEYTEYTDESHYTLAYSYDLDYTITGPGTDESGTLKTAQVCVQNGESFTCRYAVGGGYALGDYEVDVEGDIITINYAFIEGQNVEIEINDWVYNSVTGRATAGTIEITFSNGNSVLITATGTGYTVAVTINGTTTNYNVAFPAS